MQLINEVRMLDTRWSLPLKLRHSIPYTPSQLLNKVAAKQEPRTVISIMAMHADRSTLPGGNLKLLPQLINQRAEAANVVESRYDLAHSWEFVILDPSFLKIVFGVHRLSRANVNDGSDACLPAKFLNEDFWAVNVIGLSHGLESAEDGSDGSRTGVNFAPFQDILDVPFTACSELLELPA
jgi:hypothetical protein